MTLYGRNKEGLLPFIEKKAGVTFERVGAPQPADMARVAGGCERWSLVADSDCCRRWLWCCKSRHRQSFCGLSKAHPKTATICPAFAALPLLPAVGISSLHQAHMPQLITLLYVWQSWAMTI